MVFIVVNLCLMFGYNVYWLICLSFISIFWAQEYVSCPSCGRTLFDLQEISAQIREKTSHLPGVSVSYAIPRASCEDWLYVIDHSDARNGLNFISMADRDNGLHCEWTGRDGRRRFWLCRRSPREDWSLCWEGTATHLWFPNLLVQHLHTMWWTQFPHATFLSNAMRF